MHIYPQRNKKQNQVKCAKMCGVMEGEGGILPSAEGTVAPREVGVVQCRGRASGTPVTPRVRRRGPAAPFGPGSVFKMGVWCVFKTNKNGAVWIGRELTIKQNNGAIIRVKKDLDNQANATWLE